MAGEDPNSNPIMRGATPRRPAPAQTASLPEPSRRVTPGSPFAPAPPPKRRRGRGGAVALVSLAVIAALGGVLWSKLKRIGGSGPNAGTPVELIGLLSPDNDKAQFPGKNRVNVLLIGKDYNRDSKGMEYTKGSRADSIMVLSLDFDTGKVSALSVPRDTKVTAPDGKTGKINATYARGGAPLLRQTVTQLLGVAPDYFIAVKADAVKTMVNKLGGVDVETIDAMNYDDSWGQLHIHLPKGKQTIDGDQAVGFARFREVKPGTPHSREEGDPRRMARQQQLIRAMATKGKSFENIFQLDEVADTALTQLESDMTRTQQLALMMYFRKLQPESIQSASLDGKGTVDGVYFFLPDEKKKAAMVDWLLKGDETAADKLTVVAVENGTSVRGAAARVAAQLRDQGFDAENAGTALPRPVAETAGTPAPTATPAPAVAVDQPMTRILYAKASVASRAQKIAGFLGVAPTQITKETRVDATGSFRQTREDHADITVILGQDVTAKLPAIGASTQHQSARL